MDKGLLFEDTENKPSNLESFLPEKAQPRSARSSLSSQILVESVDPETELLHGLTDDHDVKRSKGSFHLKLNHAKNSSFLVDNKRNASASMYH